MSSSISVIGNLASEPLLSFTSNGKAMCRFSIADNHRVFNQDTKEWENGSTSFYRVTCWGKLAENIADSLQKGNRAMVVGRLSTSTYTDKDGINRTSVDLTAEAVGPELSFATAVVETVTKRAEVNHRTPTVDDDAIGF